jgi:hypothetical protein
VERWVAVQPVRIGEVATAILGYAPSVYCQPIELAGEVDGAGALAAVTAGRAHRVSPDGAIIVAVRGRGWRDQADSGDRLSHRALCEWRVGAGV